jgi:hypothetical protein
MQMSFVGGAKWRLFKNLGQDIKATLIGAMHDAVEQLAVD